MFNEELNAFPNMIYDSKSTQKNDYSHDTTSNISIHETNKKLQKLYSDRFVRGG